MENVKIEIIKKNELVKIVENSGIEQNTAQQVTENYQKYFIELAIIQENASKINFQNPTIIDEKIARELRLQSVKIRTESEKLKDERKKAYLLRGNLEQSVYNLIKDGCKLIEETFVNVEKAREIAEKKRREILRIDRSAKIAVFVENTVNYPLDLMSENEFDNLLIGFQIAKENRLKAEKELEEKRLAEIENEKQKQIEIQKENERLKKEALEREIIEKENQKKQAELLRLEREKAEKERKKQAEILAEQKAESEKQAELIRKEAEKQAEILRKENEVSKEKAEKLAKIEREKQAKINDELKAKIEKEKIEKEKIEKELKAKKDAEILATKEKLRIETEKKNAAILAAKAPEKEKLKAWLYEISMPFVDENNLSEKGKEVKENIRIKFIGFKEWAENQINNL